MLGDDVDTLLDGAVLAFAAESDFGPEALVGARSEADLMQAVALTSRGDIAGLRQCAVTALEQHWHQLLVPEPIVAQTVAGAQLLVGLEAANYARERSEWRVLSTLRIDQVVDLAVDLAPRPAPPVVSLDDLPDELLLHIFSFVPMTHLLLLRAVCRRWQHLCPADLGR